MLWMACSGGSGEARHGDIDHGVQRRQMMRCSCSNHANRRSFLFVAAMVVGAPAAPANLANGDPRLEKLFLMFIAPCCWRENLLVHSSPTADELRADIRKKVEAGLTDDQIKATFLARYSTRILAMPEGIQGQWLNWTPWLLSAGGTAAVIRILWRSAHRKQEVVAHPNLPELAEEE